MTQSTVIRMAAGRQEGQKVTKRLWWQDALYNIQLFYSVILTNNSSGGVDDGPGGLCWVLSTWREEQLGGEGLS